MKEVLVLFLIIFTTALYAQDQGSDPAKEIQLSRNAAAMREMDKGVDMMNAGEHFEADVQFRQVLKELKIIPANLAFYIGKNSYYLEEPKQAIDWINKYIELKGTSGQYYDEAVEILKKAEAVYSAPSDSTARVPNKADSLDLTPKINCKGKVVCPVCNGRAVIIERGSLKTTYRPCPYSDNNGYLTCDEYNLLLKGELKPKF